MYFAKKVPAPASQTFNSIHFNALQCTAHISVQHSIPSAVTSTLSMHQHHLQPPLWKKYHVTVLLLQQLVMLYAAYTSLYSYCFWITPSGSQSSINQSIYIFCLKVNRQKLRKQYTVPVMSDTVHGMHMYNTYVNSCLDVLRLLYSLAQPKVSVKVSIKR